MTRKKIITDPQPTLGTSSDTETNQDPVPTLEPSPYQEIRIWAEMLRDAMQTRIGATNRSERAGLDPERYALHIKALNDMEHECALELARTYRKTVSPSIRQWQVDSPGIGEHLLARLLGIIGHPCLATPHHWEGLGKENRRLVADEPYSRSISQLWSYCGVGDPDRKRRKGQTVEEAMACGIPMAKSILYLLAQSCVKVNRGYYREVYDKARVQYADRVHAKDCAPCGPKGRPAKVGSNWSLAHQHNAALRKVSKEILRDLWVVAN